MTDKVFVDSNVVIYGLNATLSQYTIATALRAGCGILYSEDMHHGLWVTPTLQILNPFMD